MYDDYSIDELVERSQETIGEESNQIKRELARRFRDGVGVEADSVEASYWESQIEQSTSEAEKPASPETLQSVGTVTPETAYTEADCKAMDERTLYQAFRTGAPWAVYYFSLHMKDQGEHSHALSELEELAKTLEHKMDGGDTSEETRRILALTKLQMGRLYCHDLTRAQRCFEEAALELGCREAVPDLINCYCRDPASMDEREVLDLLRQLEDGTTEERLFAANTYYHLGRWAFARPVYCSLLDRDDLPLKYRVEITRALLELGDFSESQLFTRSQQGDGVATLVLAGKRTEQQSYDKAEELYHLGIQQDKRLEGFCQSGLAQIQAVRAEQKAAQQRQADARRRAAEEEQRAREQSRFERRKRFFSNFKAFAKRHPIITIFLVLWILSTVTECILMLLGKMLSYA